MRKAIHTDQAPKAIGPYSQAILDGSYLFVSGQLPIDPIKDAFPSDEIEAQTKQVLKNIQAILRAAGLCLEDVVRTEIFLIDIQEFSLVNSLYEEAFRGIVPPARQTIQVAALPKGARIEISCIAKIPNRQ